MPIVEFADVDRDAMMDMVFYSDGFLYTVYNKYSANSAYETDLCKLPISGDYLINNPLFSPISQTVYDQSYVVIQ